MFILNGTTDTAKAYVTLRDGTGMRCEVFEQVLEEQPHPVKPTESSKYKRVQENRIDLLKTMTDRERHRFLEPSGDPGRKPIQVEGGIHPSAHCGCDRDQHRLARYA
jgi:hypothetical protein